MSAEKEPLQQPPKASESLLALTGVLSAAFMGTFDTNVVNVALRSIEADMNVAPSQVPLVGSCYILAFAALLVIGGKAGDTYGRRRVFHWGTVAFLATSLACVAAPSFTTLVAARSLQGASAAFMVPQVLALIRVSFPKRAKLATSLYAATLGLATVSGLVIGGVLTGLVGWRSIFIINVPICLFILWATSPRLLAESRSDRKGKDILGPVLLLVTMAAALTPFTIGADMQLTVSVLCALAFLLAGVLFIRHEYSLGRQNSEAPLIPLELFSNRLVSVGLVVLAVYFLGTAGFNVVLPYYLQDGPGLSTTITGTLTAALGIGFALGSAVAGKASARLGNGTVILAGCTAMLLTRVALAEIHVFPSSYTVTAITLLTATTGIAQGIVVAPLMDFVLSGVPKDLAGIGSGALLTVCNCAMAIGQVAFLAIYSTNHNHAFGADQGFTTAMWAMAALAAMTVIGAVWARNLTNQSEIGAQR